MVVKVYKGLGKPVVYFGINGDVFPYLILFWIASVVIGIVAGTIASDVAGAVTFILLVFGGYFAASLFQEKFTGKSFTRLKATRLKASFGIPRFLAIRSNFSALWK